MQATGRKALPEGLPLLMREVGLRKGLHFLA